MPSVKPLLTSWATPLLTPALPMDMAPSKNSTVPPLMTSAPGASFVTAAVKVTALPYVIEVGSATSAVLVVAVVMLTQPEPCCDWV